MFEGERVWVDNPDCKLFVDNILTGTCIHVLGIVGGHMGGHVRFFLTWQKSIHRPIQRIISDGDVVKVRSLLVVNPLNHGLFNLP